MNVLRCINYADIFASNDLSIQNSNKQFGVGGIVGEWSDDDVYPTFWFESCENNGNISVNDSFSAGGLIGIGNGVGGFGIRHSLNSGTIRGKFNVGGLMGSGNLWVSYSANIGEVKGLQNIGGCIGELNKEMNYSGDSRIVQSYNIGLINGSYNVGEMIGNLLGENNLEILKICLNECYFYDREEKCSPVGTYDEWKIYENQVLLKGSIEKRILEFFPVLRGKKDDWNYDKLGYPVFTVVFKDEDGTILKTERVQFGRDANAPSVENKGEREFLGWDISYFNIKSDIVVNAIYTPLYIVTFKDYNGEVLKIQEILLGSSASAPSNPSREGYTFIGWDKTFDKITSDLVVTAKYKENAKPSTPVSPTKPSETPEKPNTSDKNNSSNNNQNTTVNKSLPNIDITPYMFNYIYYADMNEDLKKAFGYNEEALKNHYLTFGIKEGRKASPIFDARYYLNKYSDLKKVFGNNYESAYYHFINSGISEGRQASKYFDAKYYGKKYADLKNAYGENYKYMAMHFMTSGINEGRQGSNDFNVNEYYKKASEFEKNNIKQNYIKYYALASGAKVIENNSINITAYMFDADLYYSLYPDLQKNIGYNVDGLKAHYLSFGIKEGRIASYVFNPVYYLNTYKDLSNAFGKKGYESAYYHFINSGINEGRTASKLFNAREYLKTYKDLVNIFDKNYSKALEHFVACGMKEGRTGSSLFSSYVYKKNNNDLSKVFGNNLKEYFKHYIMFGQYEKRKCF